MGNLFSNLVLSCIAGGIYGVRAGVTMYFILILVDGARDIIKNG